MNNTVIFTICISTDNKDNKGDIYNKYAKFTLPFMERYAKTTKSDFYVMKESICKFHACNKYYISELLVNYDRVLFLDADIFVKPISENIFEYVPIDKIGIFKDIRKYNGKIKEYLNLSGDFSEEDKTHILKKIEKINWYELNSGVILASKGHENCFKKPKYEIKIGPNRDQIWQSILFIQNNANLFFIDDKWNFNRPLKTEDREKLSKSNKKYFIHFNEKCFYGGHSKDHIENFIIENTGIKKC